MGNDFYLTMSRALSAMLLLLGVLCAVSAVDPDKGNPNLGPDMARTMYAEWKQQSAAHLQDVHDQISTGQWPQMDGTEKTADPAIQSTGDRVSDASGPLQCLPVQRYRSRYLEGAPDRDIAVCKMIIYTAHAAPHLDPFTDEELFHCGHCALRGGMSVTAEYYFKKASSRSPDSASAAVNYGIALHFRGNVAGAIAEYQRSLKLDPGNEAGAKNLAWASLVQGDDAGMSRDLFLKTYERAWARLVVYLSGKVVPTKFLHEQVFGPIGIKPKSNQPRTAVSTPKILGTPWTVELHQVPGDPTVSRMFVREPQQAVQAANTNVMDTPQGYKDQMLVLETGGTASAESTLLPKNLSAPASWHTINIYEFGLNRDLCMDPQMSSEPLQKESNLALLLSQGIKQEKIGRVGRRFLATVKRALTGLMDKTHIPSAILEWSGAAPIGTSSLAHPKIATMSLSLATLNRLNHSHYLDPPFPGMSLATIGMMNHVQMCMEEAFQSGVQGDVLEAGVWRGGQTILMKAVLEAFGDNNRSVWLLDTFSGIPEPHNPSEATDDETLAWQPGQYQASLDAVKANFARFDLLDDRVHFIPGAFHQTLPTFNPPKLALLRLDADTYEATADLLKHLYHHVEDGGYIIIDDFHLNGARRAVLEYRAQHNILDTIIPVPEDYVFSCGQHVEHEYHSWPKKIPQGAYWKKGGFRSHVQ